MTKLRLLITDKCNRSCPGCCNKGYDLAALPVCKDFGYRWDEVCLTGGEPMLDPHGVIHAVCLFPAQTRIFLYTAKVDDLPATLEVMDVLDGLTLTLHTQDDVAPFLALNEALGLEYRHLSLRLNVFKGIVVPEDVDISQWKVKDNMVWVKDCPLPKDEVFMRL